MQSLRRITKKLGIPILEKVAEIFLAIKPDLPIPAKITFPLQLKIKSTALIKLLLKIFLILIILLFEYLPLY